MKGLLPLLVLTQGCCLFGKGGRLPEAWVVPEVTIRLYAPFPKDDPRISEVKRLLVRMNAQIYDATDGQIRIAKFVIANPNHVNEKGLGVGNLYTKGVCPT